MGKRVRRTGTTGACAGRSLLAGGAYVRRSGRGEKILAIAAGAASRRAARAAGRGREIRVGGEIVYATETGSGKPAVLLPSMLIDGATYQPAVEALARDLTAPLGSALAIQRWIPDSTLVVSSEGGHDWLVERPAEFADAVARLMERTG
ncbi:alpha/beta fold hydrolase [Sorangium sp. So ce1000]|uniref:alpha/beta fold hydrolase n=1 Tax=Sorangium sp. So ce1000 TaxID=3133325 RepID=UPI003F62C7D0